MTIAIDFIAILATILILAIRKQSRSKKERDKQEPDKRGDNYAALEKKVNEIMEADRIVPKLRGEKKFERHAERNLLGHDLEKAGRVDEAIKLYEQNINENFEGNHPYDRLAIIYRKRGQHEEEIRVLEKAVWVFKNVVLEERGDRDPKLEKFYQRLEKAKILKAGEKDFN